MSGADEGTETSSETAARVALVTGARTGVGLALTGKLLRSGWEVATLTRTSLPAAPELDAAKRAGLLREYHSDLADFASLRSAIAMIRTREPSLDALVNNAGVNPEHFERSPQGREMCLEVNTIVPYVLAQELQPLLMRSGKGLIVNVSSSTLRMPKSFDVATLGNDANFRKLFGAYASSKLALSLWSLAAASRFAGRGVKILSADPGPTKSPLTAGAGMPWALKMVARILFKPPNVAAGKLLDLIEHGDRFAPGCYVEKGKSLPIPHSESAGTVLDFVDGIHRRDFVGQAGSVPAPAVR